MLLSEVRIPTDETAFDARKYDDQKGEVGGFGAMAGCKVETKQKINHDGEVHRCVMSIKYLTVQIHFQKCEKLIKVLAVPFD